LGTASLVAGIGLMLIGFGVIGKVMLGTYFTMQSMIDYITLNLFFGIPLVVVGALFLRKYDKDMKK